MGLFKKNPNEVAYHEGHKHFTDVIKNTGAPDLLIWRQPEEDFNTNSTLIVMPGEVAIFVKNGTIEQVFENGTYKLSTQNYPFITRLRTILTGGISTFNCVVFFVRTTHTIEMRWGTDSPIQVRDKVVGVATKLRCRGAYRVQVSNAARFLEKLVGNNVRSFSQDAIDDYFLEEFRSKIKSAIANAINESNMEILGIDARLDEFSDLIQPRLQTSMDAYGIRLIKFTVSAIDIDDDELRRRYDELGMDSLATIRKAQGDRAAQDILGAGWEKQQQVEIMRDMANNQSAGGLGTMSAGMAMGVAAGGLFGGMANQMFQPLNAQQQQQYAQQQYAQPYAQQYAQPQQAPAPAPAPQADDPMEALTKLKKLLDAGLIEQAEFDAKKAEILSRL